MTVGGGGGGGGQQERLAWIYSHGEGAYEGRGAAGFSGSPIVPPPVTHFRTASSWLSRLLDNHCSFGQGKICQRCTERRRKSITGTFHMNPNWWRYPHSLHKRRKGRATRCASPRAPCTPRRYGAETNEAQRRGASKPTGDAGASVRPPRHSMYEL